LTVGPILAQTVNHFFPELNDWFNDIPDPRFLPFVTYDKRFLMWWGLALFLFKLGSRRQLDYEFNTDGPEVLNNFNRLAGTTQATRPVNKTLNYFLSRTGATPVADVRTKMVKRLIRMKVLDSARLQGRFVVAIDGTGYLVFRDRHCEHCLTQQHGEQTLYLHQVLEAKLLGPADLVISLGTEFIDNRDAQDCAEGASAEERKQDCELKAARRLVAKIRRDFPQLRICLSGDSLFACGEGLQIAKDYQCDYIYVFKPGRTPALWQEFQALQQLCPEQRVEVQTPERTTQEYRWVNEMDYADSDKRNWRFSAIRCTEKPQAGEAHEWSWITSLEVARKTVAEVSTQGGRQRWHIENQGFNTQKNSELNLEHAYSHQAWQAFYFLLQIAHMLLQLVEKGSLLRQLAGRQGKASALALFGSLKNIARRLLESIRYQHWPDEVFDRSSAAKMQIRLDSG
jgi:hypothetical protein